MSNEYRFRSLAASLWYRLITLATVGLWFAIGLDLASSKILGWSFYMTWPEIAFEVAVRLIFTALAGMVLGSICSAILLPAVWYFKGARDRMVGSATRVGVYIVLFLDLKVALAALVKWSHQIADHRGSIDTAAWRAFYVCFGIALCLPQSRRVLVNSLDAFLDSKFMRRIAVGTIAGTVSVILMESVLNRAEARIPGSTASQRPRSSVVLITFDALTAEDMSLYGYRLPTTPNIDSFARTATVFKNFYSGSSFTTPCIATIMTGMYPSRTHVHHLHGELNDPEKTLPHLLRTAGYRTAGFFSNLSAHYLAESVRNEFDFLPEPVFVRGGFQRFWSATALLHQQSRFGNRADEHSDLLLAWTRLVKLPSNSHDELPAAESFRQARNLLDELPDGFFLWIHVMTPHAPYLPELQERGRFLPADAQQFFDGKNQPKWTPQYDATQQSKVDDYRLRYDEFVGTADRAFGSFMSDLESRGKLANTIVIISADHGESFEGGMYQHGGRHLTRPVIHVPLIIKTPGQQQGREVAITADETALAPTIVELTGIQKPEWMTGPSLVRWLDGADPAQEEGLAFTQYFEKNSIFDPLQHGAVGVIRGQYQYVLDLDTKKGSLRPLKQAQIWNLDRSAENPEKAQELLSAIYSRFPELRPESK